jgi:hypothetical protein
VIYRAAQFNLAIALLSSTAFALPKETQMMRHAHGTFTVSTQPISPGPAEGLARFSLDKQLHGELEGIGKGEMLAAGDYQKGEAGYVAIELVTGMLHGKQGSFALQHAATMTAGHMNISILVVPGSGTGDLKGISGTFTITMTGGGHSYDFEYALPPQ